MSISSDTPRENLTLSEADLAACRPIVGEGGHVLRALCPFHGSDRQRSLRVQVRTGRFVCFACGAWGYMDTARTQWREEQQRQAPFRRPPARRQRLTLVVSHHRRFPGSQPQQPSRAPPIHQHRVCLPQRGPTLPTSSPCSRLPCRAAAAKRTCSSGAFPSPWRSSWAWAMRRRAPGRIAARDWRGGRVVFPHTTPEGRLVNLYGRAVGTAEQVPKAKRHDHLPGAKGYFNAAALQAGAGPLWVCEGAFDALALGAAGVSRVVAIFGVQGWRWEWAREVRELVFALDADAAGQQQWRQLARQAALRGKRVAVLPPEAYGGQKDVNEAWAAGVLAVGTMPAAAATGGEGLAVPQHLQEPWAERVAIMVMDGGLPREAAERLAWVELQAPGAAP